MTRVDFYFNAPGKAEVARRLAAKAYQSGQCALLYTEDQALAAEMDRVLWTAQQLSFLPHVRCGHPLARRTPLLIGANADELAAADVLVNLSDAWPPCFSRFQRLMEIVTAEPNDRERARQRFRFYKERGYALETHDLSGSGHG